MSSLEMQLKRGFDPLKYGEAIKKIVTRVGSSGRERLYIKAPTNDPKNKTLDFRISNYYLKTAVADTVGCNLRCVFCWTIDRFRDCPKIKDAGVFYSPIQVANALNTTAKKFDCKYLRLTQGEPTLDMDHLTHVLDELIKLNAPYISANMPYTFILETNGLLLGKYSNFAKRLSEYTKTGSIEKPFIHVRVSIKGATAPKFRLYTFADASFYKLQFDALKNCLDAGLSVHPAVMLDFIETREEFETLRTSLENIDQSMLKALEFERLFLEDYVIARLNKHKIPFKTILNGGN
jgi:uncharacterized Fe-S cluster-containing radical SAM superfamily protein